MGGPKTKIRRWELIAASALLLIFSCHRHPAINPNGTPDASLQAAESAMDRAVRPIANFYQYAAGSWLRDTKLPPDVPTLSRSFSAAQARNAQFGRDLIAGKYPAKDPTGLRNIQNYYASCMDAGTIEKLNLTPIQPLLDRIDQVADLRSFFETAGILQAANVPVLFGSTVFPDSQDPTTNLLQFTQGGLGLPGSNYYTDASLAAIRQGYLAFAQKLLELSGMNPPGTADAAQKVVDFEGRLAQVSASFADLNDATKTYHPMRFADFQATTPSLPWSVLLAAQQVVAPERVNVQVPQFFAGLQTIVPASPAAVLRDYLKVHLLLAMAPQLPQRFGDAYFDFYNRQLAGQTQPPSRTSSCAAATLNDLGDAVAQQYVEISFTAADRSLAAELVADLQATLHQTIEQVTWMDQPTRRNALAKASAMVSQIIAPQTPPPIAALTFDKDTWMANSMAVSREAFRQVMSQAGKPVDRQAWYTNALTVNAYYDPQRNAIVVPAGILQPPFFGAGQPAAMNYGAIGAIVGHELTHGFDSNGRRFDETGKLRDWWSPAAAAEFVRRTQCFIQQYSAFQPFPGVHLNGTQTLTENIADNGGLKLAFAAYARWKQRHGTPPSPLKGLTDDQLFFVAFGQMWATLSTETYDRAWIARDIHALPQYRVNGSTANSEDFARTYSGTANPSGRCAIW